MIPHPSANVDQALHVLEILGQWTARGWRYEVDPKINIPLSPGQSPPVFVHYTNPEDPWSWDSIDILSSFGVNHFDALCQATTVMQVLLEEHPKEA